MTSQSFCSWTSISFTHFHFSGCFLSVLKISGILAWKAQISFISSCFLWKSCFSFLLQSHSGSYICILTGCITASFAVFWLFFYFLFFPRNVIFNMGCCTCFCCLQCLPFLFKYGYCIYHNWADECITFISTSDSTKRTPEYAYVWEFSLEIPYPGRKKPWFKVTHIHIWCNDRSL